MEKKKVAPYALISGILFVLMAIVLVVDLTRYRDNSVFTHFSCLLSTAGYVITAIALFMANRARPKLLVIGFIIQAAVVVFVLIDHLVIYGAAEIRAAFILSRLFELAAWVGAIMISVACLTERLPQGRAAVKKVWFVPAACYAVGVMIWWIWVAAHYRIRTYFVFDLLLNALGLLLAMLWVVNSDAFAQKTADASDPGQPESAAPASGAAATAESTAYYNLGMHVVLLLFTFGVWYLIWIYRMTGYLNRVEDEQPRNPTNQLLLCIFVPFYTIWWVYQSAQRIDKLAAAKGIASDLSMLCLILAIFVGVVPPILMQDKINAIVTTDGAPDQPADSAQTQTAGRAPVRQQTAASSKTDADTAEALKTYKELLDSGALTQEEFDAKKKQLLGL